MFKQSLSILVIAISVKVVRGKYMYVFACVFASLFARREGHAYTHSNVTHIDNAVIFHIFRLCRKKCGVMRY